MKIEFLVSQLVGSHVFDVGDVADIPDDRAYRLMGQKQAVLVLPTFYGFPQESKHYQ